MKKKTIKRKQKRFPKSLHIYHETSLPTPTKPSLKTPKRKLQPHNNPQTDHQNPNHHHTSTTITVAIAIADRWADGSPKCLPLLLWQRTASCFQLGCSWNDSQSFRGGRWKRSPSFQSISKVKLVSKLPDMVNFARASVGGRWKSA